MEEQQDNEEKKNDPRQQARNLFFQTGLTQAQIAELVGVSQKTISIWINEGRWKQLKQSAEFAPSVLMDQMICELAEIHANIASREPGKRFATNYEAEIRRKIISSLRYMREQQTTGVHTEVLANFLEYLRKQDLELAKTIAAYADNYLVGEKDLDLTEPFKAYSLPGQVKLPPPTGHSGNSHNPQPPPEDEATNEDTSKAA